MSIFPAIAERERSFLAGESKQGEYRIIIKLVNEKAFKRIYVRPTVTFIILCLFFTCDVKVTVTLAIFLSCDFEKPHILWLR